jgi:hypothetical protein
MNTPTTSSVRKQLAAGQSVLIPVSGSSMGPAWESVDAVLVHRYERPPRPGKVILFEDQGQLKTHRLILYFSRGGIRHFLARGDGDSGFDLPLPLTQHLLGEVVALSRGNNLEELSRPAFWLKAWFRLFTSTFALAKRRLFKR